MNGALASMLRVLEMAGRSVVLFPGILSVQHCSQVLYMALVVGTSSLPESDKSSASTRVRGRVCSIDDFNRETEVISRLPRVL